MNTVNFQHQRLPIDKIICVGRNYSEHIEELGNTPSEQMVLFMKPAGSINNDLVATHLAEALHFETEICLLLESGTVVGVSVGLDLTKRDTQSKLKEAGLPWERAKAFSGSALFAPFVDAPESLDQLSLQLTIDEEPQQQGSVKEMIYQPSMILQECATHFPKGQHDIVMTGTPKGVGALQAGQTLHAKLFDGKTLLTEKAWRVQPERDDAEESDETNSKLP